MKALQLSNGDLCVVDDDVAGYLNQWQWTLNAGRSVFRRVGPRGKTINVELGNEVLRSAGKPTSETVDHRNGCWLDNRLENLRAATRLQNNANQRKQLRNTSSKYKGVSRRKHDGKWRAYTGSRPQRNIGLFASEVEAARAYDAAAVELYGEFACINFPEDYNYCFPGALDTIALADVVDLASVEILPRAERQDNILTTADRDRLIAFVVKTESPVGIDGATTWSFAKWCRFFGIDDGTARCRIKKGLDVVTALTHDHGVKMPVQGLRYCSI